MIARVLLRHALRGLPAWDRASRLSLALAVVLLIGLLALGFGGPAELQFPARIGAFGCLLTLQLLFFWGNRRSVSPYHQAQRQYMAGEYAAAREILEAMPRGTRQSVDALILLGHCYRQLNIFDSAKAVIDHALELKPGYHYALFAKGKLSLVSGSFAEAAQQLKAASEAGAPDVTVFELGQACFMVGDRDAARAHFSRFLLAESDEDAKIMLSQFYLHAMDAAIIQRPEAGPQLIQHWRDEAERYAETAYGAALKRDIDGLARA